MFGRHKHLESALRETGRSAQATVLASRSGMTITKGNDALVGNTVVVCKLRLQVTPEGEPAFEADADGRFSQFAIPSEGDVLSVLYDPEDHDKVVVDQSTSAELKATLVKQIARFRSMNNDYGTTIADKLEEARRDGRLDVTGEGKEAIRAYNLAFGKVAKEASAGLGLGDGPVILTGRQMLQTSPLGGARRVDAADEIKKLADLRDRGALTDAEFDAQKAKILEQG